MAALAWLLKAEAMLLLTGSFLLLRPCEFIGWRPADCLLPRHDDAALLAAVKSPKTGRRAVKLPYPGCELGCGTAWPRACPDLAPPPEPLSNFSMRRSATKRTWPRLVTPPWDESPTLPTW